MIQHGITGPGTRVYVCVSCTCVGGRRERGEKEKKASYPHSCPICAQSCLQCSSVFFFFFFFAGVSIVYASPQLPRLFVCLLYERITGAVGERRDDFLIIQRSHPSYNTSAPCQTPPTPNLPHHTLPKNKKNSTYGYERASAV